MSTTWEPPGPGTWWLEPTHFPMPVSGIFADLFPPITQGWDRAARRWGRPGSSATWGVANHWLYYSSGSGPVAEADPELAARAATQRWWREEARRWREEERPHVVATNLALQHEPIETMDDAELRDHVARGFAHYSTSAPLHFEHYGDKAVKEALRTALADVADDVDLDRLLAGSSPASARPAVLVGDIADQLLADGADTDDLTSLDDIRAASPAAGQLLDAYLGEYGWRLFESYDPVYPTLGERTDVVLACIRAAMAGDWRKAAVPPDTLPPWHGRADTDELDELLADAREAHGLRDDDDGTCFFWTMGLVRRALLEVGRRLRQRGRVRDPIHVFEAATHEVLDLLDGNGPPAEELERRSAGRIAAAHLRPPPALPRGEDPAPWAVDHDTAGRPETTLLRGLAVGTGIGRGPARNHRTGGDVLDRIEPGDVLIAVTTTPAFNAVFPLLAAVAVEQGNLGAHAAVLGRELGIPVVVGVAGLLDAVPDGALVEVDSDAGTVRVVR